METSSNSGFEMTAKFTNINNFSPIIPFVMLMNSEPHHTLSLNRFQSECKSQWWTSKAGMRYHGIIRNGAQTVPKPYSISVALIFYLDLNLSKN